MRVTEWIRDDIAGRKSLTPDRFYERESQEKNTSATAGIFLLSQPTLLSRGLF